jgi:hypothetical protein
MKTSFSKMTSPQATASEAPQAAAPQPLLWRIAKRIASIVILAFVLGWVSSRLSHTGEVGRTAGFTRGLLHGATMPLAVPNLLVGDDVEIYSPNNTGRTYKLGYTVGINVCGAFFFGFLFWRISRWKKSF